MAAVETSPKLQSVETVRLRLKRLQYDPKVHRSACSLPGSTVEISCTYKTRCHLVRGLTTLCMTHDLFAVENGEHCCMLIAGWDKSWVEGIMDRVTKKELTTTASNMQAVVSGLNNAPWPR